MNMKSKVIILLLVIAVILFCAIEFFIIPKMSEEKASYALDQTDSLTHDISAIEKYKSQYVGSASNTANLFYALPLCNVAMEFQIDSENCILTVNYLDTVWNIGEEKVQRDLVYNSAAAMAAIDNLAGITYNFTGESYFFSREQLENIFGSPLSSLLDEDAWSKKVQEKLNSPDFVGQFY